jgi:23S rRNA (adenine1618-N6)-methyltransferase
MAAEKKQKKESRLHKRNKNRERYDLEALIATNPELSKFVKANKYGDDSIDFANPKAVKALNNALLKHYYGIQYWDFPDQNLCPPIPGRADYIHYVADLLREHNYGNIPTGDKITCLDVGVGASCIYPILGVSEYNWNFIASDIDQESIESAKNIAVNNPTLKDKVEFRLQENQKDFFYHIINKEERFDISICNPPFHASQEDALKGSQRKIKNLSGKESSNPTLNFSGVSNEMVYEGGELRFIKNMIKESKKFAKNAYWFTTLVSKQSNLKSIQKALSKVEAVEVKEISMGTGNKSTRIVAWSFLSKEEQNEWKQSRWNKKTAK